MENKCINQIKILGMETINRANSGHPGIVLGSAAMLHVLYTRHLKINPSNPDWFNRDRFILSAGHGSALLYAINHLSGFNLQIEDLKRFRKPGNTPGHPEYGHTDGIDMTTGPLGQGIASAVGFSIAETHLASKFNKDDLKICDHFTYVLCGDGDLQEGVSLEALSLAGHLGLGKLVVLYDSNDIQLDGSLNLAYSDDCKKKFEAMHWQHILVEDGTDVEAIDKAIKKAKKEINKPTIIEVKTIIGQGTTNEGTSKVHGSPIGDAELNLLKEKLNYKEEPFMVSLDVYDFYKNNVFNRGQKENNKYNKTLKKYQEKYTKEYEEFTSFFTDINVDLNLLPEYEVGSKEATRNISGQIIDKLSELYNNLIGGSADLTSSTKAKGANGNFSKENKVARNINFGVREHAMAAIANGIALHKGLKIFVGGFFVFSDYMKPSIRLSSIMGLPVVYVFTHDSVCVGEDGPTHEPIEQLTMLRSIPGITVLRPCDANETKASWKIALESKNKPTAIILTRQNVLNLSSSNYEGVTKGAYIICKENSKLDGILLASGSEVELAIKTKGLLFKEHNIDVRVVSMPSMELFNEQSCCYKKEILPNGVKTLAIEMGASMPWFRYTNNVFGIDTFGISAPLNDVITHFGFVPEKIIERFLKIESK